MPRPPCDSSGLKAQRSELVRHTAEANEEIEILQLTSEGGVQCNIYCEVPYMDRTSRYVMFTRGDGPDGPFALWRADLDDGTLGLVFEGVQEIRGAAVSPDQEQFCIALPDGEHPRVLRVNITTLEREVITLPDAPGIRSLGSIGPDGETYIYGCRLAIRNFGICRANLQTGESQLIHEDPEICNPHPQIEPLTGEHYLIQHNRGCEFDDEGNMLKLTGGPGATLYLIDPDGEKSDLPVGEPHTHRVQGHQCWIPPTGEILLTIAPPDGETAIEEGNLLAVRPGDDEARTVASGHNFCHPNASRDGRFFVSDSRAPGTPIVVGSIQTGQSRILCESGASLGRSQYTHPHPYFSPDCNWVIYNSDATGIPQVYAARVPEGFLEALES